MEAKCPSHMLYNAEKMKCDKADRVKCGAQTTKLPEGTSTESTNTSGISSSTRTSTSKAEETTPTESSSSSTTRESSTSSTTRESSTSSTTIQSTTEADNSTNLPETTVGVVQSTKTSVPSSPTTISSTTASFTVTSSTTAESELTSSTASSTIMLESTHQSVETTREETTRNFDFMTTLAEDFDEGSPVTDSDIEASGEEEDKPITPAARQLIPMVPTGGPWTEVPPISTASTLAISFLTFTLLQLICSLIQ